MTRAAKAIRTCGRMGLVLSLLVVVSACASVPAEFENSRLALQRGVFSGDKYTFDGSESEGVYTFWGTYNSSFTDLLSQQPAALAEAKGAEGFMYASLGVTILSTFLATSELIAALNTDNNTLAGISEQEDHLTRAVGAALGGLILSGILRIPVRNRLHSSVGTFNAGLSSPDTQAMEPGLATKLLPDALGLDPVGGQVTVGWTLRH